MEINKNKGEKVDDYFRRLHLAGYALNNSYQEITLDMISNILKKLGRFTLDIRDTVWCLLNNEFPSLFANSNNATLSDGSSVAHIGGYIGILMRGGNRLDREGRDYWIKPLRDIGAIKELTLDNGIFVDGHIKAKSPNSCYALSESFIELLSLANTPGIDYRISQWISDESLNKRLALQLELSNGTKANQGHSAHKQLITDSINIYARHFLKGYVTVFTDADDGDRITEKELAVLKSFGIKFGGLTDVWPDAILYNKQSNSLWFIEAVTSDGEVDKHKLDGLHRICQNSEMNFGGATTTYPTWKKLAARQQKERNLEVNTYIWIKEDPEKQLLIQ